MLSGEAEAWSSALQNSLCACHARLDIAYLGMDDSSLRASSTAALQPQANPLTAPEPITNNGSTAVHATKLLGQSVHRVAAVQTALDQLAGFLDTIERLLTGSFPVAVPIPAHAILMLLTRMLSLDDSARQTGSD